MVARIRTGKSMHGALRYNENKVEKGQAVCLAGNMFGFDVHKLTIADKIKRFAEPMGRNRKSKTHVVHISLNFAANERNIEKEVLIDIANTYMEMIGFGNQPYLVYQHFDSAHPHVHILSTSIQDDGRRIPLHNLGRIKSEEARKQIEERFRLVKAEGQNHTPDLLHDLRKLPKACYGKDETRKAISQAVSNVTRLYKYTSIHELNAVLSQYNVLADRGREGTTMFKKGGLVYFLIDERGDKIGVPFDRRNGDHAKPSHEIVSC